MKRLVRQSLGCICLGVFITNATYYILHDPNNHPLSGVVSMTSWILMWIFLAMSSRESLSEKAKFGGAFTMSVAFMWLLYHIVYGAPISEDLIFISLVLTIVFFAGAVNVGVWWTEVSPVN